LPKILSPIEVSCPALAADHSILAIAAVGIDIVSKLTLTQGNYSFIVVAVEYFTKWIDAKHVTNVSLATIQNCLWQNIICRYGVPQQITVDNAKYFDSGMFKDFCHPQSNGVVE
jgi:hypothetical protein